MLQTKKRIIPVLVAILPVLLTAAFAATAVKTQNVNDSKASPPTAKAVLAVDNMTCGGCAGTIQSGLHAVDGVKEVRVALAQKRVTVIYDTRIITDTSRLAEAVTALGYPADLLQGPDGKEYPSRPGSSNQVTSGCICGCGP
ncbi:MAG: heavy metal-associated domain-containing protein [Thermodesulfobacteriota bacterium]|nr:heavy metal-associated domain-containing protein [Thermodesulfobacteriota bacterium]